MKVLSICLFFLILSADAFGESSVRIGETIYVQAYKEENKDGSLREFIPPTETLKNWTTLVGIRIFPNLKSPREYILNLAAEYKRRFPLNQFAIFENHKTGGWIVDYIIFPSERTDGIIEWNYFEAVLNKTGNGIIVNQFAARRTVVGSVKETMKAWDLAAYRNSILSVLMTSNFPITDNPNQSPVSPSKSGD